MLGQITDPGRHMNDPDRDPDGSSPCRPKGGQARPQDFANENKPWSIRAPRAPPDPRRHRLHERFERPVPTRPDTDPLAVPAHSPEHPVSRPERTSTADHTRRDTHRRLHSARRSTGGRDMRPGRPPSRRRHISSLRNYGLCGPMSLVEDTSPTATPMWHTKDLGRLIVLVVASSNSPVPVSPPGSR